MALWSHWVHDLSLALIVDVLNERGFFGGVLNLLVPRLFILPIWCVFSIFFFIFCFVFHLDPLQNTSVASPTSRMPVPLSAKSRQSPGTTDKAGKQQKLQDAQRQFRQVVLL